MKEYIIMLQDYQWINPLLLKIVQERAFPDMLYEILEDKVIIQYPETWGKTNCLELGLCLGTLISDKHVDEELG